MQNLKDLYKQIWEAKSLPCKCCGLKHTVTFDKGFYSWKCGQCGLLNNLKIKEDGK